MTELKNKILHANWFTENERKYHFEKLYLKHGVWAYHQLTLQPVVLTQTKSFGFRKCLLISFTHIINVCPI